MFNFNDLIGQEITQARNVLSKNGYNNVRIINNANENKEGNCFIVCRATLNGECVDLVCGKFLIGLKEK